MIDCEDDGPDEEQQDDDQIPDDENSDDEEDVEVIAEFAKAHERDNLLETVSEEAPLPVNQSVELVSNLIDESMSLLCSLHNLNEDTCLHYDEHAEEQAARDPEQ